MRHHVPKQHVQASAKRVHIFLARLRRKSGGQDDQNKNSYPDETDAERLKREFKERVKAKDPLWPVMRSQWCVPHRGCNSEIDDLETAAPMRHGTV